MKNSSTDNDEFSLRHKYSLTPYRTKQSTPRRRKNAVNTLLKRGDTLFITLQSISEFWNVCTRPSDKNGLGFSVAETDSELKQIEQIFDLLPDTMEVYKNWRELVVKHSVSGIQVHDAKIAAAKKAHNIENLLTFNAKDFKRYSDIKAVEPKEI